MFFNILLFLVEDFMKVYLIYNQFFSPDGKVRKIGGVETYMEALCSLFEKNNVDSIICQFANHEFKKKYKNFVVWGFPVKSSRGVCKAISSFINKEQDLIIFMNEVFAINIKGVKTLTIQHGTYWDNPYTRGNVIIKLMRRIVIIIRAILYYNRCKYHVAVDYNFYNWYKTLLLTRLPKNLWIIPNFANKIISEDELSKKNSSLDKIIKIIFARRFIKYRGSILFAETISLILDKYSNVEVTIAGEGPCEGQMKQILYKHKDKINFIKYLPEDSFNVHKEHDIAVIPTISCEGTSLSLLEAMGAGCLVVATPIGGMSNIIIDGFNGYFSMPDKDSLFSVIEKAINTVRSSNIPDMAVNTIKYGFSLPKWEEKWWQVISCIMCKDR